MKGRGQNEILWFCLSQVMLMGLNGQPVATVSGSTSEEHLVEKIEEGKTAFAEQVGIQCGILFKDTHVQGWLGF